MIAAIPTTYRGGGQTFRQYGYIDWDELDMTLMSIVIEATALVLSGDLERSKQ